MISDKLASLGTIRDRFLNEEAQMGIVLIDTELRVTAANHGALRMLKLTENEVMGRDIRAYLLPDSHAVLASLTSGDVNKAALSFRSEHIGLAVLRTTIYSHDAGHVLFAEQLLMTEERTLGKMTELTNELAGMTRTLQKQKRELEQAQSHIKVLQGLLPICSACKKIRDDEGYWQILETYIKDRCDVQFTHGMCPDCIKEHYPDIYEKLKEEL